MLLSDARVRNSCRHNTESAYSGQLRRLFIKNYAIILHHMQRTTIFLLESNLIWPKHLKNNKQTNKKPTMQFL